MYSRFPPFHWWRTVFFLIPAISLYTIVLGTLSISSLFEQRGHFAHWCARTWSRLILVTTGVHVDVTGLERLVPGRTYLFVANHQSIYDIPILFWSLPYQLSSPRSRWDSSRSSDGIFAAPGTCWWTGGVQTGPRYFRGHRD
jgi:1-acyl-sn-glycerol-3-phosphate acyltransferase